MNRNLSNCENSPCIGKMAYVSQTPWVFSGTVIENIVFGMQFAEEKYKKVIEVCDLGKDIDSFPKRDQTEIGQRGVILSGGQRARVSLARAIYSDADIYLLDDPLSAIDAKVGKHLFDRCIKEYLAGRVRILATHQLQFLKQADNILLLQNGSVVYQGTYGQMEKDNRQRRFSILSQGKQDPTVGAKNVTSATAEQERRFSLLSHGSLPPIGETNNDGIDTDISRESLKSVTEERRKRSSITSRRKQDSISEANNDGMSGLKRGSVKSITSEGRRRFSILSRGRQDSIGEANNEEITDFRRGSVNSVTSERRRRFSIVPQGVKQAPQGETHNDLITASSEQNYNSMQNGAKGAHERVDLKDEEEERKSGSVKWWLYWKYFRAALPVILIISLGVFFLVVQGK